MPIFLVLYDAIHQVSLQYLLLYHSVAVTLLHACDYLLYSKHTSYSFSLSLWMMQIGTYAGPNSAPLGSLGGKVGLEPGGGHRRLQVLLSGLEAANILLAIMASPGIDRRAVEDDAIEACVNLIKNHLQKHLMPALSNTGHLGMSLAAASKEEEDNDKEPMPRAKRVKTSPQRGAIAKGLKAVYSPLLSTVGTFETMTRRCWPGRRTTRRASMGAPPCATSPRRR